MTALDLSMPIVVTRHQCPHCRRYTRARRDRVEQHMARCWQNPAARGCKTCRWHQEERWSSHQCHPGHDCGCDSWPEACCHEDGPKQLDQPIINCEYWEQR
jgi:hypothetical protein